MSKFRLARLALKAQKRADSRPNFSVIHLFLEAFSRGKILGRDGKERKPKEWLRTLPKYLSSALKDIMESKDCE